MKHLPGYWTFVEVAAQVYATDEQIALANFGFKNQTEFTIRVPVVDDLYYGPQLG